MRAGTALIGAFAAVAALVGLAAAAEGPKDRGVSPTDLSAAALAADPSPGGASDGNGVFEPGETVVLAPSWHSIMAVPVSVVGAVSAFTGPGAPGLYTITDPSAEYQLPAGATRSCLDGGANCYSLSVGAGPRPAVHWDATVFETLTNASIKSWVVHLGGSFSDVPRGSPYYRFVETLLHNKVTSGCAAAAYCPGNVTTREQMAVFVLAAREGSWYSPPGCVEGATLFSDVPSSSPFCPWVEELSRRAVVGGCGLGAFCPASAVSREQMAVFALRTREGLGYVPPACVAGAEAFADVPASSPFCAWIEELARRGVVSGCGGGNYCPAAPVTREQMSVFLSATFGLSLYGTQPNAFVVNSTNDLDDGACTPIHCSWREAVAAANSTPNGTARDEIRFALPGPGPFTIRPSVAAFTDPVVVDGYSQPGSSPNTLAAPQGLDAVPLLELDLSLAGALFAGSSSLIRGLVLNGGGAGVNFSGQGSAVEGCFIGTDPTGTVARPNGDGVVVPDSFPESRLHRIGGLAPAARNLISGNARSGVYFLASTNVVQGNLIGTDRSGTTALGNGRSGVFLDGAHHLVSASGNVIGGLERGAGNVIAGSPVAGVELSGTCCASLGSANDNRIQANVIGRGVSGVPLPNGAGILLNGFSDGGFPILANNLIGGSTVAPAGNLIASNGDSGIRQLGGSGTRVEGNALLSNGGVGVAVSGDGHTIDVATIRGNSIFDNGGLGIATTVTGASDLPVLSAAQAVNTVTAVSGVVHTSGPVIVDFYASPTADPSGFGEGKVYLGSRAADPGVAFTATLPAVPVGWVISATSTYAGSRTSGFAQSIPVTQ